MIERWSHPTGSRSQERRTFGQPRSAPSPLTPAAFIRGIWVAFPGTDSVGISPLGEGLTGRGEHPPSPVSTLYADICDPTPRALRPPPPSCGAGAVRGDMRRSGGMELEHRGCAVPTVHCTEIVPHFGCLVCSTAKTSGLLTLWFLRTMNCHTSKAVALLELLPSHSSQLAPLVLMLHSSGTSQPTPAGALPPSAPSPEPGRNQK